jgi:hypothetical protein
MIEIVIAIEEKELEDVCHDILQRKNRDGIKINFNL